MKTLYLLRHAKSSWGDPKLPDHDRPLNERGRHAAVAMGCHLRRHGCRPDLVMASTARRVGETLELLLPELAVTVAPVRDVRLYLADANTLLSRLRAAQTEADSILMVGHNPGLQEFAVRLAGEVADAAAHDARDRMKAKFPTAAIAVIVFATARSWRDIGYGLGRLESFSTPRDLKD